MSRENIKTLTQPSMNKLHEMFDLAWEYNKSDETRTELSRMVTSHVTHIMQDYSWLVWMVADLSEDRPREIAEAERDGCVYRQVYEDEAVFECSHCGATWCYECGSPIENEQHFCWRCGRPIKSIVLLECDENYELVEVEKSMAYKPVGICSGCVRRGEEICGSCVRNGRGNDTDFYSKEKEK